MPYALALSNELLDEKFDAIVIDEAQDFSDEYWFGIEELLKDISKSYLYIFIDQNQEIYKRHGNLPVTEPPYHLTANCRNTASIHKLAYNFYKGEEVDEPDLQGPNVQFLVLKDKDSQVKEILNTLSKWISKDAIKPGEIVLLIAGLDKDITYEALENEAGQYGVKLSFENHGRRSNQVLVDSVYRYKGLESNAVILWVGDETVDSKATELIYVGISRAKTLLSIVASHKVIEIIKEGFK
jgi:superfamily I DNA/RNA helicase